MNISCAIIDDEPLAAGLLKSYADNTPFLELKGVFNSAVAAIRELRQQPVDLLFLDIQMPELSGMEFAKILPPSTKIIFTTAFSQYAIEGYKVNALDYLLKPISYDDFIKAANKALEWFIDGKGNADAHHTDDNRFIFVKSEYKLLRIDFDDILFIEGLKDYVRFHLSDGHRLMSLMSMKAIDDNLPHPEFMRTHRSYIVHMTKVTVVDRLRIIFGDNYIPISENYKDDVMAFIESHALK
jgi:DNA-binding LytR/AlgR family response regulator